MRKRICQQKKADGTRCQAPAIESSTFCFWHDPAKKAASIEAARAGGSRGKLATLPGDIPDIAIESVEDVVRLLGQSINQVRRGELDSRVANAIGYLAGIALRGLELQKAELPAGGKESEAAGAGGLSETLEFLKWARESHETPTGGGNSWR